jgi:hypothetical protein
MSSVACDTHIVVDGPLPVERVHTLLTVPGVLVDQLEAHWDNGVISFGYPEGTPALWHSDLAGTFRTKEEGAGFPQGTFTSFFLYVPVSCSALGMSPEEFAEKASRVLQVTQSFGVEQALARGLAGLSNPFLSDANMALPAGATAVSARVGVSYLEEAIGATARGGIIHVTPAVAEALQPIRVTDDPTVPLYTGAGTPVAVGAGYQGTVPVGQSAPSATRDWIFASGPVEVRIDEQVSLPDISDALDRVMNDVTYRAEKVAVVSWDTALQAGVLVDWSL